MLTSSALSSALTMKKLSSILRILPTSALWTRTRRTSAQVILEGTVGSVACGDLLKFQVEVDEDGKINNAVFKAFGCGSVIASSAYATELLKGMDVNDAYKIKNTGKIIRHLPTSKITAS